MDRIKIELCLKKMTGRGKTHLKAKHSPRPKVQVVLSYMIWTLLFLEISLLFMSELQRLSQGERWRTSPNGLQTVLMKSANPTRYWGRSGEVSNNQVQLKLPSRR